MKFLVLLGLAALAAAHWPYADFDSKFRMGSLIVSGPLTGPEKDVNLWVFSALNNQRQPTFTIKFPTTSTVYTIQLSHIAEVQHNGGTYDVLPMTSIEFNLNEWDAEWQYFYDDETFGEVVLFEFVPDAFHGLLNEYGIYISLKIYPDSYDDLVDIKIISEEYTFANSNTMLAVFFKVASSDGQKPSHRNLPYSIDYTDVTVEMDQNSRIFTATPNQRRLASSRPKEPEREKEARIPIFNKQAAEASKARTLARLAQRSDYIPPHVTNSQLWPTGGYLASIIGYPGEQQSGKFITTITLALRTTMTRA